MQIDSRLKRVESALNAVDEREHNIVAFVDEYSDKCELTLSGAKHQGTKEEIEALLEPYITCGSTIIRDDLSDWKDLR